MHSFSVLDTTFVLFTVRKANWRRENLLYFYTKIRLVKQLLEVQPTHINQAAWTHIKSRGKTLQQPLQSMFQAIQVPNAFFETKSGTHLKKSKIFSMHTWQNTTKCYCQIHCSWGTMAHLIRTAERTCDTSADWRATMLACYPLFQV